MLQPRLTDVHVNVLIDAGIILDTYEVDLPALPSQVVDQFDDAEDTGAGRLAWLFRPFQGSKE